MCVCVCVCVCVFVNWLYYGLGEVDLGLIRYICHSFHHPVIQQLFVLCVPTMCVYLPLYAHTMCLIHCMYVN